MSRLSRVDIGGETYHVLNRAVGKLQIFTEPGDYLAFIDLLREASEFYDVSVLSYTVMPNHWHLLLKTKHDGDLSTFMHWLTTTHTRKVHAFTGTNGTGPLYQGRYKSFLVDTEEYLHTVALYIERNPVRAKLCEKTSDWRWGSGWLRVYGTEEQKMLIKDLPKDLLEYLQKWADREQSEEALNSIRNSIKRGVPYGRDTWVSKMIDTHGLIATVRPQGRPKNIV